MKSIKRRLKQEINQTSFDKKIPSSIKERAGIDNYATSSSTTPHKPKRVWLKYASSAAGLCCILALALFMFLPSNGNVSNPTLLTININPAIEFTLDDNGNVKSQRALNREGEIVLLGNSFVNSSSADACRQVILISQRLGLLKSNPINIMVIDDDAEKEKRLYSDLQLALNSDVNLDNSLYLNAVGGQTASQAKKYGIGESKMFLIEQAEKASGKPFKDLMNMPTQTLVELANGYDKTASEKYKKEIESQLDMLEDNLEEHLETLEDIIEQIEDLEQDANKLAEIKANLAELSSDEIYATVIDPSTLDFDLTEGRDAFIEKLEDFIESREEYLEDMLDSLKMELLGETEDDD